MLIHSKNRCSKGVKLMQSQQYSLTTQIYLRTRSSDSTADS